MAKKKKQDNKPVIETMINTCALALTAAGTNFCITEQSIYGFVLIAFGAGLEFFKYWGRQHNYW
jgi:hypothetical protein